MFPRIVNAPIDSVKLLLVLSGFALRYIVFEFGGESFAVYQSL
jgi:hypothetical protein